MLNVTHRHVFISQQVNDPRRSRRRRRCGQPAMQRTSASRGKNRYHVGATNRHAVVSVVVEKASIRPSSWKKITPLRGRGKNCDASMWRRRRRCRKKELRKSANFQQKFVWLTYTNNAHRNSGCPLYISEGQNAAWTNYIILIARRCLCKNEHERLRENKNNTERTDWKFRRVVEKIEDGNEKSKSRRCRNVVAKSQSGSKTLDSNDDRH